MNIYEKLQKARVELQSTKIKKSGENKFAKYNYYELADFLPKINELCEKYLLLPVVMFDSDVASLTVYDAEKPGDQIVFTSPMAGADLKGCHPIQNMGAVETYQRRYLYMTAFEIVEHDALDATAGAESKPNKPQPAPHRPPQASQSKPQPPTAPPINWASFWSGAAKLGFERAEVHKVAGVESISDWTRDQLTQLNDQLRLLAKERKGK